MCASLCLAAQVSVYPASLLTVPLRPAPRKKACPNLRRVWQAPPVAPFSLAEKHGRLAPAATTPDFHEDAANAGQKLRVLRGFSRPEAPVA